jgi:hypothetical protein
MICISERNRPCIDRLDALMTQAVAVANAIRDNSQDEQQPIPIDLVLSFSRDYDKIITALSDASSYESIRQWLLNAKSNNASQMEIALSAAIDEGRAKGGMRLTNIIAKAADEGSTRDAQWMLTHSPAFRKHYSDNAAILRAKQEGIELAVQALAESELPPEQERNLLLRIQSKTGEQLVDVEDS